MANLKYKKGKEFLWAISRDQNEYFIYGKRLLRAESNREETSAQDILDEVIINEKGGKIK